MIQAKRFSRALLSSVPLWLALVAAPLRAATIYEQMLPSDWQEAVCSGCNVGGLANQRVYAAFDLFDSAKLTGLEFAVVNGAVTLGDFSVSIWRELDKQNDKPFREIVFAEGTYASETGRGYINVDLPDWQLGKGHYYLSIFGVGEEALEGFQWGLGGSGDDLRLVDDLVVQTGLNVGFRLFDDRNRPVRSAMAPRLMSFDAESSAAVPVPGTLGLLGLGLVATGLLRRRNAPAC